MVILGLILVLVAVVAAVVLIYENGGADHQVSIHAFGGQWQADAYWMAILGAAILLVAVLGLALLRSGSRRSLRKRNERRQLKRDNEVLAQQVSQAPTTREGHGPDASGRYPAARIDPDTHGTETAHRAEF